MSPLKLILEGQFWDSQIYEGRLYLFDRAGSLLTLNWDALLANTLGTNDIAIECGFRRGDYLYGAQWDIFFGDLDIKEIVTQRFASISNRKLEISSRDWSKFIVKKQDNPFPFPHADSAIHYRTMIVGGPEGLSSASISKKNVYPIARKPSKHWDCPVYSIAAGNKKAAVAAGDEGLWETPFGNDQIVFDTYDQVTQLSSRRSDKCNWMYGDLYGSSYSSGGFLTELSDQYRPLDVGKLFDANEDGGVRHKEVEAASIFKGEGFSWGVRNKICLHDGEAIHVSSYAPWTKDESPFSSPERYAFPELYGSIVSGGSAPFGSVVEFDNRLIIILSDGVIEELIGEPVNWRVFPTAKFYQNQLHVVYADHLNVFSFNQDYFVDQKRKKFGITPMYDRGTRLRAI